MSAQIENLWPSEALTVNVLSPRAILGSQASFLTSATRGVLRGDVSTTSENGQVSHSLDAVAPALDNYRVRLLEVRHAANMVYPASLHWLEGEYGCSKVCANQQQFLDGLADILKSQVVVSIVQSLLARSNEADPH